MKRKYKRVDYASSNDQRQIMTNYLRVGPFQQISGHVLKGRRIYRRRLVLMIIALAFLIIGLCGVFR